VANVIGTLNTVSGYARSITDFGLRIIVALLVVDVLFPGSTQMVRNVGGMVGQFGANGLAGLIAVLLFLLLYKNK
tara:strand:+ start:285 stop:509 length:225 start_codon:yes stop_codon:yes gene_type:complete